MNWEMIALVAAGVAVVWLIFGSRGGAGSGHPPGGESSPGWWSDTHSDSGSSGSGPSSDMGGN